MAADTEAGQLQGNIENLQAQVVLKDAMKRLLDNPDFMLVFDKNYIEAFAITNTYNIAGQNPETRARTHEKMIARSHFSMFVESLLRGGEFAEGQLNGDLDEPSTEQ